MARYSMHRTAADLTVEGGNLTAMAELITEDRGAEFNGFSMLPDAVGDSISGEVVWGRRGPGGPFRYRAAVTLTRIA